MAFFRGSTHPMLGGVSRQHPAQRLPDQVTEQVNLLSDPVTGIRRRGGFRYVRALSGHEGPQVVYTFSNGGDSYMAVVGTDTGTLKLYQLNAQLTLVGEWQSNYLQGTDLDFLQHQNDLYILNREITVQEQPVAETGPDPAKHGYYYIQQGAFDWTFNLQITVLGNTYSVEHVTPSSNAKEATPDKVAEKLKEKLDALDIPGVTLTVKLHGGFVYLTCTEPFEITSSNSDSYVRTSGSGIVKDSSALPARLPAEADGSIMQVGHKKAATYYRWSFADTAWIERCAYGDAGTIENLPIVLEMETLQLRQLQGAARTAGDTENVPPLKIIGQKISGFGSFQGRLVLMQGENVLFSKSNDPEVYYRNSMVSLSDDDPIEIAGTSTLGTDYRHSLMYNGDLLLLSATSQGVVPGRNVLTPQTAVISTSSHYAVDTLVRPSVTGRSVLYSAVAGTQSSVWEMFPSEYNTQGVQAQDVTLHLPSFFQGRIQEVSSSNTAGFAVVRDESNVLKIHQFVWEGYEKAQSCWHEWTVPGELLSATIAGQKLMIVIRNPNIASGIVVLEWEISGWYSQALQDRFHWDYYAHWIPQQNSILVDSAIFSREELQEQVQFGTYTDSGAPVTFRITDWVQDGSYWRGTSPYLQNLREVYGGIPYESRLTPTPPLIRDRHEEVILTERALLHSFNVSVHESGEYRVRASDVGREVQEQSIAAQRMYSYPVEQGLYSTRTDTIPLRLDLNTAEVQFVADGPFDWNLVTLEYAYRYNQRQRRAQGTAVGG